MIVVVTLLNYVGLHNIQQWPYTRRGWLTIYILLYYSLLKLLSFCK